MTGRPIPQLPADIVQTIFDLVAGSENNPLDAQKRWITLSLVQKEWARLALRYRRTITLPTPLSVKRFTFHAPKLLSDGIEIREFRVENVTNLKHLLRKLYPLLPQTLRSVSIPLELLDAPEVIELCKPETCKLEKVHLVGGRAPSEAQHEDEYEYDFNYDYESGYVGDWWGTIYGLLRIPTLLHLELANLAIDSGPSSSDIVPSCQIETLHLRNFRLPSVRAGQHLASLLGRQVRHLYLTNVRSHHDPVAIELCRAFGKDLLSLKLDRTSMADLVETCFDELSRHLPALRNLEMHGADVFSCYPEFGELCFLRLPKSLRH